LGEEIKVSAKRPKERKEESVKPAIDNA